MGNIFSTLISLRSDDCTPFGLLIQLWTSTKVEPVINDVPVAATFRYPTIFVDTTSAEAMPAASVYPRK